jgi:hypothetical protein
MAITDDIKNAERCQLKVDSLLLSGEQSDVEEAAVRGRRA